MKQYTVALFGEAEKGDFQAAHFFETLPELVDSMGQAPPESCGLHYAVQALLYQRRLLYIRVQEEGYSFQDYLQGLRLLAQQQLIKEIAAICLPGVGNTHILEASKSLCRQYHSILIFNEADLYDYLTQAA